MESIFIFIVVLMFLLAITDLIVGVSNDAVNFLNSAIGARAGTFKRIMIVASIGIMFGSVFSSGMMEVARRGVFNPPVFFRRGNYVFVCCCNAYRYNTFRLL
jgi:phosphate/sulfate permease